MSLRTLFASAPRAERDREQPARLAKSRRASLFGASTTLDQTAGEGLRRSVLLRNALARSREQDLILQEHAGDTSAFPSITTSDYDYEEDEEEHDDLQVHLPDNFAWLHASHSEDHAASAEDDEVQFFDELLEELGSAPLGSDQSDLSSYSSCTLCSPDLSSCDDTQCACTSMAPARSECASSLDTLPSLVEDDAESEEGSSDSEDEALSPRLVTRSLKTDMGAHMRFLQNPSPSERPMSQEMSTLPARLPKQQVSHEEDHVRAQALRAVS